MGNALIFASMGNTRQPSYNIAQITIVSGLFACVSSDSSQYPPFGANFRTRVFLVIASQVGQKMLDVSASFWQTPLALVQDPQAKVADLRASFIPSLSYLFSRDILYEDTACRRVCLYRASPGRATKKKAFCSPFFCPTPQKAQFLNLKNEKEGV